MSSSKGILSLLVELALKLFTSGSSGASRSTKPKPGASPQPKLRPQSGSGARHPEPSRGSEDHQDAGASAGTETVQVDPDRIGDLTISYAPDRDGDPDAGEVIWTWVPYEENDGRGKDRPVLVIARHSNDRVYAVRMTSKAHDGDRDYLSIGSGDWDSQGRESWVDVEQLYSVHVGGMRREAAGLDRARFGAVAAELTGRYGWRSEA